MIDGEKLYEELFSVEEAQRTYELENHYVIIAQLTEVSTKIDLKKYPNIKKFNTTEPFNTISAPSMSKLEIKEFLTNIKII